MKPQIIQDAEDNWPEDEAALLADSYHDRAKEDAKWAYECGHRDVAHMHKVFSMEDDAGELVKRFSAELLKRGIDVSQWLF